jgi:hypothetical protein
MSAIVVKTMRDKPGKCPRCRTGSVPEVYANWCRKCRLAAYLEFRRLLDWPMDELAWRNFGPDDES